MTTHLIDIPKRETLAILFTDASRLHPVAMFRVLWFNGLNEEAPHGVYMGALAVRTERKCKRGNMPFKITIGDTEVLLELTPPKRSKHSKELKSRPLSDYPASRVLIAPMPKMREPETILQLENIALALHPDAYIVEEIPYSAAAHFMPGQAPATMH